MSNKNLKINLDATGRRLDNYLFNVYKSLPKSKIYNMIRKGEIRVNSGRIKPTYKLKMDDEIRIPPYLIDFNNDDQDIKIPPKRISDYQSSILFENNDYIVVNKDSELSVHSGSSNKFGLIDIARAANPDFEIDLGHRIDKSTSGCIILSKNKRFLREFHNQLKNDKVEKIYEAIVFGNLKSNLEIESKIDTSTKEFLHKVQESDLGKIAKSEFIIIKRYNGYTHVHIKISTGRMHQIRVQSASMKHPIINDTKYGIFSLNKTIAKETGISRLALHSSTIKFTDLDGSNVSYKAQTCTRFDILLNKLSKVAIQS
jgi:23S rRNA pseudouridine955/2504/2580 synthase